MSRQIPLRAFELSPPRHQRGILTLIAALGVLLMVTIVTLLGAEVSMNEQRVAANEMRQRQAFENAEAGFEYAVSFIHENGIDCWGSTTAPCPATDAKTLLIPASTRGARYPVTDGGTADEGTSAVELCDADAPGLPSDPTGTCTPPTSEEKAIVYARGWSDDDTGLVNVVALLVNAPGVANEPTNPLTARGTAVINGSGDVTNPEGTSTIWTGQSLSISNANFKTNIKSPTGSGVVETSNRDSFGYDVIQNDGNLSSLSADAFFQNWFGVTPTEYHDTPYWTVEIDATDSGEVSSLDGMTREIIWVEGDLDLSGNPDIGTADDPVIMIVNGDLGGNGNPDIYGLLYVHGDNNLSGNFTVTGAAVVGGNAAMSGSLDITFDSSVLDNLGTVGRPAVSAGSWKDWI